MSAEQNATPGDATRAMLALERAAEIAERGVASRASVSEARAESEAMRRGGGTEPRSRIVLASPEDLARLAARDLRPLLDRVIMGEHADEGLDSLLATGVLVALMPEVASMVGFSDGEWRHKDVWKHTKQVVIQAAPRLEVRWAALFHDIGKVKTRSIDEKGEVHFFGHAEVGARMFDKLERRQKLFRSEESLESTIRFLVLNHLRASQYDGQWTDSAVRRFAREIGPHLEDLLCLSRADITTKRPEKKRRGISMIDQLAERITLLAAEDAKLPPLPSGVGDDIMRAFGLPPSRKIGDIKRALEAAIEAGELPARQEIDFYVQFLAENKQRFGIE